MKKANIITLGLILSLTLSSFTIPARWEYLGYRKVNKSVDRDEILVTRFEGRFNALKIKVTKRPIVLYDIKVHYGNGSVEDLKTRVHIPAGGESRVMDLQGRNRVIKKVVFRYETQGIKGKRAELHLLGRH